MMKQLEPGDWVLFMNDMRSSNIENHQPVCAASTKEELIGFLESELVEPYQDGRWGKTFRSGGPLEWMNPLDDQYEGYGFSGLVQYAPPEHRAPELPTTGLFGRQTQKIPQLRRAGGASK